MQVYEDEGYFGKDLSSKLQIDASFLKFLHVRKKMCDYGSLCHSLCGMCGFGKF